jgi:hypothetical protein
MRCVTTTEDEERQERAHRFLDAADVEDREAEDHRELEGQLEGLPGDRKIGEHRLAAARDGDGDRQHVVDRERGPRDDARAVAEELVATAYPPPRRGTAR